MFKIRIEMTWMQLDSCKIIKYGFGISDADKDSSPMNLYCSRSF